MHLPRFYILLCFLLSLLPAQRAAAQRYPFYNLQVEDGLAQSQPTAIVEDRQGYLWIGTLGGLSRYDGKNFRNFTTRDGLPGNMVRALALDTSGHIWIGGAEGLSRFDGRVFQTIPLPAAGDNEKSNIRQIAVDGRGVVWVLAGGKLYFLQEDSARLVSLPFTHTFITAFLPNHQRLWVAAANGKAYQYYQQRWDSVALPVQDGNPALIQKIYQDREGKVWLAGINGLWQWQRDGIVPALPEEDLTYTPVFSLTEDRQGGLWLGCAKGVIRRNKDGSTTHFGRQNGLSDNIFSDVFADRAGNIWMASDGQGVFRFSGAPFTIVDETTGLGSGQVMSLAEGREGEIFLGTYDAGLYRYYQGLAERVALPVSETPSITALDYHDGVLWLGTRSSGLWRWDGRQLKTYRRSTDGLPSDYIISLYRDSLQQLWVGTARGAAYLQSNQLTALKDIHTDVQAFLSWNKDSILLTGSAGMWWYTRDSVVPFVTGTVLDELPPQTLARTGNWLWAGTSENGLVIYDLQQQKSIVLSTDNVLRSDFIYSLLVDREGRIWVGTGLGVHRISGYNSNNPQIAIYGSGQKIAGMESNHNAILQAADGTVWLGTTAGAMLFPTKAPPQLAQNTTVVLKSVSLPGMAGIPDSYYDSLSAWNQTPVNMRLPYRQNTVSFTFQSLALVQQRQVRYRHRLLGLDTAWSPWVAENTITYSALPPGAYRLEVQSGIEGNRAPVSTFSYPFIIETPFHKSVLFRVLLVVFFILLGIGIQYLLSRRRRRLQEMIRRLRAEEQAKVRQRTAEDFHDEVGNRITRISVLTQVLKGKLQPLTDDSERLIAKIQENASLLYNGTRDILWALQPENDNLYELLQRLNELGVDLFRDTPAEFYFAGARESWRHYKLPMDVTRNLMMIFKEGMNNCLKYAAARRVNLIAEIDGEMVFTLVLEDDGQGFDTNQESRGQGLNNMRRRAERIGGALSVKSSPGAGAAIKLTLPLSGFMSAGDGAVENGWLVASLKGNNKNKKH